MKVFITGGMGFIGSYIVKMLIDHGHEVTILARNPAKIPSFQTMPKITIIKGSLSDFDIIENSLPGHDACIHNALGWGDTPLDMLKNDTLCSVFIFEKAATAGVKHLIYTSSTAALGDFRPDMDEEMKSKPNNYYCATKAASEEYLLAISHHYPMRCNIIRPGYTFGNPVVPGSPMEGDTRFKDIVAGALDGKDITLIKNDGTQFIWAGDLALVYKAVLESRVNRSIYFGLARDFITWERIAQKAIEITGSKSRIVFDKDIEYDDRPYLFTLNKIRQEFGFSFENWEKVVAHVQYLATNMGL
jgi:UDP-glucose 4-epimerase